MIRILVTGGSGQLGSEFKFLSQQHPNFSIEVLDRSRWDICSEKQTSEIFAKEKPDVVINCAAYTAVDKAEEEPRLATETNDLAVAQLARIARENDTFLIHFSTDYVFDGNRKTPYRESDMTNPLSVYGSTKREGEKHVLAIDKSLVLRVSWLFSTFGKNFLKTMIKLGKERSELAVVNDQLASPTYARLLAGDVLQIIESWSAEKLKPYGLFHYSHEGTASWFDFAEYIFLKTNIDVHLKPVSTSEFKTTAQRPLFSKLDNTAWKSTFQRPTTSWKEATDQCIKDLTQ